MNFQRKMVKAKQKMQFRADDLKKYAEQRAEALEEIKKLTKEVEEQQRAFTEEENQKFDELEKRIKEIDAAMEKIESVRAMGMTQTGSGTGESKEELQERAFEAYIRGKLDERADTNLTFGDNGAIIPQTIAQKILKKVYDICPIYQKATKYNARGTLTIPYYDESTGSITMAFSDEFKSLESNNGKYLNITLNGFLAGALSKISKSLINNSQFDVVSEVVTNMAFSIARFIENNLLNGTEGKVDGLSKMKQIKVAASSTEVTMDELIELKDMVKDVFQNGAVWIMNTATRTAIRKMKDDTGRYLMQDDVTSAFGTTLLGKPVYVSDNMSGMETGKRAIIYGDLSGLAVKLSEDANIQVLHEKYADEHAVGVIAWMEFDAKVENEQKLAALKMA